jgi:hypothetical protein
VILKKGARMQDVTSSIQFPQMRVPGLCGETERDRPHPGEGAGPSKRREGKFFLSYRRAGTAYYCVPLICRDVS